MVPAMRATDLSAFERAFIETALSLTARLDVARTCAAVLDAAERMYAARSSWILLHDPLTDELVTVDFRGPDACTYANARVALQARTIVGIVFATGEPLFVPRVQDERRWHDATRVHHSGLQSVLNVPLVYGDAALGVLGLDSPYFSAGEPPSAADMARLQAIAAQAATGIRNARLFEAAEQDRVRLRKLLQQRRQLRGEVGHLRREVRKAHHGSSVLVGESRAFMEVLAQLELVAPADSTVLLVGETGTGKELIARAIHDRSPRREQAFIAVNCAALPDALVESELFGFEKGAFTGAFARKPGKFELADRGTMFLDEIGDLPLQAQAKLLRVLQEREVQRVGGVRPVPINVRLIAATNQDLEARMHVGEFRPDLFYRLSVFPIALPPLRARRADIPQLVTHFLQEFAERQHKTPPALSAAVMQQLVEYDWPGNVRELQNVIERAVILARQDVITEDLVSHARVFEPPRRPRGIVPPGPPSEGVQAARSEPSGASIMPFSEAERLAIVRALETTGWRISGRDGAADVLGLKPTTLHAKMKKLGIRRPTASLPRPS